MPTPHLLSPAGFRASAVYAGIRSKHHPDVALLVCDTLASAAAAFTTNKVFAAPIKLGRQHIKAGKIRAIVVNAGNANACTGPRGDRDALRMCQLAAGIVDCPPNQILPSSTGIIGHALPMKKLERGIVEAGRHLGRSADHAAQFADAILTTDLVRKTAGTTFKLGKETITIAGVCKGSGMIGPRLSIEGAINLSTFSPSRASAKARGSAAGSRADLRNKHATMLAYLTTDANIPAATLRNLLASSTNTSFNAVTVDDHMSTNDTAAILASGLSAKISSTADQKKFAAALDEVCQSLAHQIAADGEGATKTVAITVRGTKSPDIAKTIARAIANSPLVKTAMHGNDPNWGRLISAAGYAAVPFDPNQCVLKLQGTIVFRAGRPVPFNPAAVSKSLAAKEVTVDLDCRSGKSSATVWTCDLSKQYITINADYHT